MRRLAVLLAVAALLGTTLAIASPAQAQTASGATAAAAPVNRMVVFGDSLADGGYYLTLDPRLPRDARVTPHWTAFRASRRCRCR